MTIIEFSTDERLQVTIKEAARLLSFDMSTVRRKIATGDLEATGHGQSTRVTMASLRAYVERNKRG